MKTAVCLYVRNEENSILEWVIYNFVIGFDTVIVMDNLSDDDTVATVERCRGSYDVRVESWPDTSPRAQCNCYNHVLQTYGSEFDWIAFIDSDEYIVPVKHRTITQLLESAGGHSAVGVNWAVFGSSGHLTAPSGLVIENYRYRAPEDFGANLHIKSIVRPSETLACAHPHLFHLKSERWDEGGAYHSDYVDSLGREIIWSEQPGLTRTADLSTCRIHHYFTRSKSDWDRKMRRRWRDVERDQSAFNFHDRNEILDECALVYAEELNARLRLIA